MKVAAAAKYPKLFEPARLGCLELKNRIVMPAMAVTFASKEGYVTKQLSDYFLARARGGVGLIIVGMASVDYKRGQTTPNTLSIDDDKCISGLSQLVQATHLEGAKVAIQLQHGGGMASFSVTGVQPVAASPVLHHVGGDVPRSLTVEEIAEIVHLFASAAVRAMKAGFDGVELHCGGFYLINGFLSTAWNKRRDDYGGSLENRARVLLQIIGAIRREVGPDYPLWCRINADEHGIAGGTTIDEATLLAKIQEEAGCNAIHITCHGRKYPFSDFEQPEGSFVHLAAAMKKVVRVPVIAVGNISPEVGEQVLREGKADLIAMGRRLLADPELPLKVAANRDEDIRPCITCKYCTRLTGNVETGCTVNPDLGREGEFAIRQPEKVKRVLVIGGGPAGMEAALVAALRGHKVTLMDKGKELGGLMRWAALVPHRRRIRNFSEYLARQLKESGVKVIVNQRVTDATLEATRPDSVVLATGSKFTTMGLLFALGVIALTRLGYPEVETKGMLLKSFTRRRQLLGVQTPFSGTAKANKELLAAVLKQTAEVYLAGDCLEPASILQAVADGASIGHGL